MLDREEALYDQDLLAWAEQQAAQLRAGRLDRVDVELEAIARAAWPQTRGRAAIETGRSHATFPAALPYDPSPILGGDGASDDR